MQGGAKGEEHDGEAVFRAVGEDGFSKVFLRIEGECALAEANAGFGHAADAAWLSLMRSRWRAAAACREERWEEERTVMVGGIGTKQPLMCRSADTSSDNERPR